METWICKKCGYAHQGDEAPEQCPQCGASKYQFYREETSGWKAICITLTVIVLLALTIYTLSSCHPSSSVDNSPVAAVDIYRYLGKWYEIARFDHRFERNMTHCIANYRLQDDGTIKVTNQGKKNGKWKTSEGKGKLTNEPGVLRVSFFGPFHSDYRIMMLPPDYSYALVGGDDADYLWILSRTPKIRTSTCDSIINEAQRRGYETDNLIWVDQ